jgi:hypothetical protein
VAANTDWVLEWTPLAAAVSTRPSSGSTANDRDAVGENVPLPLYSTKSRTHTAEVRRASHSVSASYHAVSSAPSCLAALSRRSANQAGPDGRPRSRSKILAPGHSSRERCSSCFRNSATTTSRTSTRKVSLGNHPSLNSMAVNTTGRRAASPPPIAVWWRAVIRISSNRCFLTYGGPTLARHSSELRVYRRVSFSSYSRCSPLDTSRLYSVSAIASD